MSRYIKQDDIFELVRTGRLVSNSNFESVCKFVGSLPTIEVSEDCISRADFIEMIKGTIADATSHGISPRLDPHFVISMAKSAPSVIPKPKEGEWIYTSDQSGYVGNPVEKCSVCGVEYEQAPFNYCPNCGADMRGGKNDQ